MLYFLQSREDHSLIQYARKTRGPWHGPGCWHDSLTDQVWGSRCVGWVRHCQSMALQVISMARGSFRHDLMSRLE